MKNIIVIPYGYGHGHMTTDMLISVYIALLIVHIFIFLIRAMIWLFKNKKNKSFYNYTIYSDTYDIMPNFNTNFFVLINIVAGFIALLGVIIDLRK
jgi:hypothetical protein